MLAIQVMQQILKDARMRDAADQIRTEVLNLGDDLGRLRDRVLKLQKHFGDVNEDVRQILISADKIEKRAGRIEELDFTKTDAPAETPRMVKPGAAELFPLAAQAAGGGVTTFVLTRSSPGYSSSCARLTGTNDGCPIRPNLLALRHDIDTRNSHRSRSPPAPPGAKAGRSTCSRAC